MSKLNHQSTPQFVSRAAWAWLLPLLALSSLPLAGSACSNSGVIGDDCPTMKDCATAGSSGSGSGNPVDTTCGGLLGTTCAKGLYCEYAISSSCGATDQTGICKATPEACDDVYAPVCGCDGMTYGNDCSAHSAGVSVSSKGECAGGTGGSAGTGGAGTGGSGNGASCGGLVPKTCPAGQYCNFPAAAMCGSGDQTGSCSAKPQACDLLYAPVCGCDGMTYGNDCAAASAGVSVAKTGECGGTGKTCGGRGGGTCATDEYCNYTPAAMCGRADATGTCTKVLDGGCLANYDPVCGCDGMTYGNACEAGRAGASVDHTGACGATGGTCGGLRGSSCATGFFCNYPADMACGNADGTGTCTAVPQVCNDIAAPVCGCDGKPYANACEANAKGTSVANTGACK